MKVTLKDIEEARGRLKGLVKKTKVTKSEFLSEKLGIEVFFKWENDQEIKSFKIRGALNKILSLSDEEKKRGLIAASAGNHAQGVAFAASYLKIPARIYMMEGASKVKVEATKKYEGVEVILKGKSYDESYEWALKEKGEGTFIHPFLDPLVVAGQGTVALEILEDLPDLTSLVCPLGGGGLLSGLSIATKSLDKNKKVYASAWSGAPDFCKKFNEYKGFPACEGVVEEGRVSGLTDGIAMKKSEPEMLDLCKDLVDGITCVSKEEIARSLILFEEKEFQILEGSGASALAGLIKNKNTWKWEIRFVFWFQDPIWTRESFLKIKEKYGK